MKSPGDGLPPYELEKILGKVLTATLKADESITWAVLDARVESMAS
jgi:N-acetylneuraminate synthase/sialic acid synthase